ncbi:uncharacterized protein [Cherax quadricarinatus]|uniref:uncharacterized protein n=1 Tax=Cherax quadricarinatus TaxID=27406 RepID=UPI00387E5647
MDGGGGGGWQDVGGSGEWQSSRDGSGMVEEDTSKCVDGSSSSGVFHSHSSSGHSVEGQPLQDYYYGTTNNNDYSKYTGSRYGVSGMGSNDLPHTVNYDPLQASRSQYIPGGRYRNSEALGYNESLPVEQDYSDSLQGRLGYSYLDSSDYSAGTYPEQQGYSGAASSQQRYSDLRLQSDATCSPPRYSEECSEYSECSRQQQQEYTPSRVQVTAKVLFGSVSAISNLKQKKKTTRKK